MAKQAAVTFFYQSSFTVAIEKTLLVFSYWQTDQPALPSDYYLTERDFQGFNNIVVFVPRDSKEHHDPVIYTWKKSFPITYVVCSDAAHAAPKASNVRLVKQGDVLSVAGVRVAVHGSSDEGVSFMVRAMGLNVFHAGDLNLWHWREENTLREITQAEELFYRTVADIPKDQLDICMFPVDPNLGGFYDAGANHFIMTFKPSVFFPMHWANRAEIALDYARRMRFRQTTVFALTQPRETALIDFSVIPPAVRSAATERGIFARSRGAGSQFVELSAYIGDDPFSETDLPVDIPDNKNSKKA